jgi:hypothetical protein
MSAPDLRVAAVVAAFCAAAALAPSPADAATVQRYDVQGAAGACQPALASHAAALRTRPLAMVNEGSSPAFVTCTYRGDPSASGRRISKVLVNVGNVSGSPGVVNCTFVNGRDGLDTAAVYRTKGALVNAGGAGVNLTWQPSEIAGTPTTISRPAVQCTLPKGTAVHYISVTYDEDIGG